MNTLAFHWSDLLVLAVASAGVAWLLLEEIFEVPRNSVKVWAVKARQSYNLRSKRAVAYVLVGDKPGSGVANCITCLGVWVNLAAYPLFVWLSGYSWSSAEWWQHCASLLVLMFSTSAVGSRRRPAAPTINVPRAR